MVGLYAVDGERIRLYSEQVDEDTRHAIELIMTMTKYTESDLLKKDFVEFTRILIECEERALREIEKQKQQNNG